MSYLIDNIPHFKCWVRKEFTHNHEQYHGEFLHAIAIAVNTIPDRSLSFQVVFTGCEADLYEEEIPNVHGGGCIAIPTGWVTKVEFLEVSYAERNDDSQSIW